MNLLEDSVDVDGEGLGSLGSSLWDSSGLSGLVGWGVSSGFSWHFDNLFVIIIGGASVLKHWPDFFGDI